MVATATIIVTVGIGKLGTSQPESKRSRKESKDPRKGVFLAASRLYQRASSFGFDGSAVMFSTAQW